LSDFLRFTLMLFVCFKKNQEIRRTDCRLLLLLNSRELWQLTLEEYVQSARKLITNTTDTKYLKDLQQFCLLGTKS
jgi:hypothetical protein